MGKLERAPSQPGERKEAEGTPGTVDKLEGGMQITDEQLLNWFTYHSPQTEQLEGYKQIRSAGLALAKKIVEFTPASADQSAAIRKVREAVFTANAAIACEGK